MSKAPVNNGVAGEIKDENFIMSKVAETHISGEIPKNVYADLARCFLPDMLECFEDKNKKEQYYEQ